MVGGVCDSLNVFIEADWSAGSDVSDAYTATYIGMYHSTFC